MKGFFIICLFSLLVYLGESRATDGNENEKKNNYIVYMGAATSSRGSLPMSHKQLIASVLDSNEQVDKRQVYSYSKGFSGCAVWLTAKEAHAIAQKPEVLSVFLDPVLKLHTTRSWDFLNGSYMEMPSLHSHSRPHRGTGRDRGGTNTVIGLLDSGIWPESQSFNDKGMGPIPSRWKGKCMEGHHFNASLCNRKLIGARYYMPQTSPVTYQPPYNESQTPRDADGHGTHTASTAGGTYVPGASYNGLAAGTARGGSPGSRIAVYKVCTAAGCLGSTILAGFDDAISDGVDVLSLSLGSSSFVAPDFLTDPIAIGSLHAVEKGITVVCSAGNEGPDAASVVNAAPWILTVGATTLDREFESDVLLGGNQVITGKAINFSKLQKSPRYPLLYGKGSSGATKEGSYCYPDAAKIKGKIVLCQPSDRKYSKQAIMNNVINLGGIGLILVDELVGVTASYGDFPMTIISAKEATKIQTYINSTRNPVATILATKSVTKYKPAPKMVYFSSRGPSAQIPNILKPDIAAPGVNILAAWIGNDTSAAPLGQQPSPFHLLSGTSMACPHVSGVAATIKSLNPDWSPSAIRSAIMTTATQMDNARSQMSTDMGSIATPYDYGAGEVSPSKALQPGLVFEATMNDYLQFLCNYGYNISIIILTTKIPSGFSCPKNSNTDLISQLNYPSIAISNLTAKKSTTVNRTVTNVGDDTTYTVSINSPNGVKVKVVPERLQFTKSIRKLSYQVILSLTLPSPTGNQAFGSITWTSTNYKVQTPLVVVFSSKNVNT